jgi:hypothetical protein
MEVHDHTSVSSNTFCGSVISLDGTATAVEQPRNRCSSITLPLANRRLDVAPSGELRLGEAAKSSGADHIPQLALGARQCWSRN